MDKPLNEWTEADLQRLVGTTEGLTVEFKGSNALRFTGKEADKNRKELAKDVIALANAAGGRIYYGISENKDGEAVALDDGLGVDEITVDRIGNLLTGNIEPKVVGLTIHPVKLKSGKSAFIIDVPQATTMAPHQNRVDKIYYRRHDRAVQPMFDHEIKDLMRRGADPELDPTILFTKVNADDVFEIDILLRNVSNQPVLYWAVDICIDKKMQFVDAEIMNWQAGSVWLDHYHGSVDCVAFSKAFVTPNVAPLFKPRTFSQWKAKVRLYEATKYPFSLTVSAPGFHGHWEGYIGRKGNVGTVSLNRQP